jgi:hypothetical protein
MGQHAEDGILTMAQAVATRAVRSSDAGRDAQALSGVARLKPGRPQYGFR